MKQTADCQQIPPRRSLTSHQPPAFPFASSRLRVSPTVPKGLPCTHCVPAGTGGGTGDTAPEIPPDEPRWLLPCSEIRNFSREVAKTRSAKWGTHHREARSGRSGGHTTEAGDTPLKTGTHHHEADCRLQQIPPRRSLTLHRPPAFPFASSRLRVSPTVPKGLPCTHCVAGGTGEGVPGRGYRGHSTRNPPPTSHAGFSHAQIIAIPHAKPRRREAGDTPL